MKTLSFRNVVISRKEPLFEIKDLDLSPGLWILLAPNGYGKSTFLQTLAGILPKRGQIQFGGVDLSDKDAIYISEYLRFPKFIYPNEWIDFVTGKKIKFSEIENWIKNFKLLESFKKFLGRLSQGQRRKITWLCAQASPAQIVLMDEPLDGLDLLGIQTAKKMLNEWLVKKRLVIISSHQIGDWYHLASGALVIRDQKLHVWQCDEDLRAFYERLNLFFSDDSSID